MCLMQTESIMYAHTHVIIIIVWWYQEYNLNLYQRKPDRTNYQQSNSCMTPEQKELRAIARFYKDTKYGFATKDGYYAIPLGGKKLAIVHNGAIIKFCGNEQSARNLVDKLRKKRK